MEVLDMCTLRMAYEWDKLYLFNKILKKYPHIGSVLCVSIKLADPIYDYYYPEVFQGYAIKVHISLGAKAAAKLNIVPFYPTRALEDYPELKNSKQLRFFKSGYTVVPFMGPMIEFHNIPMRYSKRFKTAVFENAHYLRWGFDHLARSEKITTVQLGTGFTLDPKPLVDSTTGHEYIRFINDDQLCSVYHKDYDPSSHECLDTSFQKFTQYLGTSYIWELINYGADFKNIHTPRIDYRLEKEEEDNLIERFMFEFYSVRDGVKPFPLGVDARKEWGLVSIDSVWYMDGDRRKCTGALFTGDQCTFSNVDPTPPSIPIPNNLQTDKYGFPLTDQNWWELCEKYSTCKERLGDAETVDFTKFSKEIIGLFGTDILLEGGIVLTRDVFLSQLTRMSTIVKDALPHLSAIFSSRLTATLAINSMTIDVVTLVIRAVLFTVKTILIVMSIFLLIMNVIDFGLHAGDPADLHERLSQSVLDQMAVRSVDALLEAFGERNPRVDLSYLAQCFSIPSALTQFKIAFFMFALQPKNKFELDTNVAYLLGVPCLYQMVWQLWETLRP